MLIPSRSRPPRRPSRACKLKSSPIELVSFCSAAASITFGRDMNNTRRGHREVGCENFTIVGAGIKVNPPDYAISLTETRRRIWNHVMNQSKLRPAHYTANKR